MMHAHSTRTCQWAIRLYRGVSQDMRKGLNYDKMVNGGSNSATFMKMIRVNCAAIRKYKRELSRWERFTA